MATVEVYLRVRKMNETKSESIAELPNQELHLQGELTSGGELSLSLRNVNLKEGVTVKDGLPIKIGSLLKLTLETT